MTVSLRDVLLAVGYGDASLVGETSGYLILGAADCAITRTESATASSITVTEEGAVKLEGVPADEDSVERALRTLLGQLLARVRVPSPNLQRVAERQNLRGLHGFVSELEAALVPVNRRAARRALARLCRESQKSAARARSFVAVEEIIPVYEEPLLPEGSPIPLPPTRNADALPRGAPVPAVSPASEAARVAAAAVSPAAVVQAAVVPVAIPAAVLPVSVLPAVAVSEPTAPPPLEPLTSPIVQQRAEQFLIPALSASQFSTAPENRLFSSLEAVVGNYGVQTPVELGPESFEFHEENEQMEASHYCELHDFDCDDDLDEEPTRVYAGVAPPASHGSGKSVGAYSPAPISRRSHPLVQPKRVKNWSDEESLISLSHGTLGRRPSDINELLDHMTVSQLEMSEVYAGLKSLSRVDLSPLAPPVGGSFVDEGSNNS